MFDMISQLKIIILLLAHGLLLLLCMVIIANKMQNAMNNDPVQFLIKSGIVKNRIFPDGIDAYEEVPRQNVFFAIVKCYYVCEKIMIQISDVYIKDIIVRTEDDIDFAQSSHFTLSHHLEPSIVQSLLLEFKLYIFTKIRNHNLSITHDKTLMRTTEKPVTLMQIY